MAQMHRNDGGEEVVNSDCSVVHYSLYDLSDIMVHAVIASP